MENITWHKIEQRKKENLRKAESEYYALHDRMEKRRQEKEQEEEQETEEDRNFCGKCAMIAFGIIGIIYFAIPMIEAIVLS